VSAVAFNQDLYGQLLANALTHVIRTDEENVRCIAKLETLLSGSKLSSEERQLADLLTVLIERYEAVPDTTCIDSIRTRASLHGRAQSEACR
jgi:hypothetical protein